MAAETSSSQARLPWFSTIRFKALSALALVALLVVVASAATSYILRQQAILEEFQERTRSIAATGALALIGDDLELLNSREAVLEPEFLLNQEVLQQIRDANELKDSEIYVLRPLPDFEERFAAIFILMPGEPTFFGNEYIIEPENREAFWKAFNEGVPSSTGIYEDEEGTWISSYAPIRSFDGRPIAVLEVDAEISRYIMRSVQALFSEIGVGMGVFLLALVPGVLLVNRFTAGLLQLKSALNQFETGSEDVRLALRTGDEVEQVSNSFNEMATKLQRSREALEASNAELTTTAAELRQSLSLTNTIMATVQEGLCLITPALEIEPSYSIALESMFAKKNVTGTRFLDLIRNRVTGRVYDLTDRFLKVLFNPAKNNHLIPKLNPLKEVEFTVQKSDGQLDVRYYAFSFDRVWEEKTIKQALVTITDITPRIALTRELKQAAQKMERQAELLFGVIHIDPQTLGDFTTRSRTELEAISHSLSEAIDTGLTSQQRQEQYKRQVESIMRRVHRIKGDAAMLKATFFENAAHEVEEKLAPLRSAATIDGNDFVPVVLALSQMIQSLDDVKEVVARVGNLQSAFRTPESEPPASPEAEKLFGDVRGLVEELAKRHDRNVMVRSLEVEQLPLGDHVRQLLHDAVVQLTRNSVVHGSETAEERAERGKVPKNCIDIQLFKTEFGPRLVFRDDGRGLDYHRLAERALELESESPGILESLIDPANNAWRLEKLAELIFHPGFSTLEEVGVDAGRGTGLDIVKSEVEAIGGKVQVASETGHFCAFIIDLPESPGA